MNEDFIDKFGIPERGTIKCPACLVRDVYRLYYHKNESYVKTDKTLRFCEGCGVLKIKLKVELEHKVLRL